MGGRDVPTRLIVSLVRLAAALTWDAGALLPSALLAQAIESGAIAVKRSSGAVLPA